MVGGPCTTAAWASYAGRADHVAIPATTIRARYRGLEAAQRRPGQRREPERESAALAQPALQHHLAAHGLDQLPGHGQPEARAARVPPGFQLRELLEHARLV